eukprot:s713_g4.t1
MTARDIGDPPCLGRAGDVLEPRTNTAAVALETARERARAMVAQARAVRRARSGGDAGGGATSSARASTDPPPSQPVEVPDPEEADGDALDEDSDDVGMMQLTPGEEARLSQLGVNDEVRRRLRELLGGLARQDDWDVGPEYRWGVQQVVEAAVGAHATARCVVDVLAARVRPSEAMRSFPCQRIPPHGVLRSRIVAWLAEFRWVVVQAFDRELEEALLELTGCPPGEAHVLRPAGDPQLGWQRATRDVPRGSRSRSRSPRDGATVSPGGTAEAIHTGGRPPSVADAVASTSPVGVAGAAAAAPPTSPSSCALPCSPTTGVIGSLPEGVDTDEPQLVPGGTSALSPLCPSPSSATATSSGPALGVPSVLAAPPDSGGGEPRVQPGAGVLVDVVLNGDLGSSGSVAPRPLRQRFALRGPIQEMSWDSWQPGKAEAPVKEEDGWWPQNSWQEGGTWSQEQWTDLGEATTAVEEEEETSPAATLPSVVPTASSFPQQQPTLVSKVPTSRQALQQAVFRRMDVDQDEFLNGVELHPFAVHTGFEGDVPTWFEEYELLCQEYGCDPVRGMDQRSFFSMVDTSSESGCYCSDEELAAVLKKLSQNSTMAPRDQLKCDVFGHFDQDSDGRLNLQEARKFAEATGFDGDDATWKEEFADLCKETVYARDLASSMWSSSPRALALAHGVRGMAHVTFIARSLDGLILVETWDDSNKVSKQIKDQAKQLLRKLHNMPPRCSVEGAGEFVFHYTMENGVCYMALFDKGYPKNLAFCFLEDIHMLFQQELQREFGTGSVDYRSHIETIEKPYYFIKFDRQITKKNTEYRDPKSSKALGS